MRKKKSRKVCLERMEHENGVGLGGDWVKNYDDTKVKEDNGARYRKKS